MSSMPSVGRFDAKSAQPAHDYALPLPELADHTTPVPVTP